jgi:hypothetical protein
VSLAATFRRKQASTLSRVRSLRQGARLDDPLQVHIRPRKNGKLFHFAEILFQALLPKHDISIKILRGGAKGKTA